MMKVVTITTCNKCGITNQRDGAQSSRPNSWGYVSISQTVGRVPLAGEFCPICTAIVLDSAKEEPKTEEEAA
jgi:hypothetical protein